MPEDAETGCARPTGGPVGEEADDEVAILQPCTEDG